MRLIPARRRTTLASRYADAAREVLGSPGRRVTPLAVLMAHDIACASPALLDARPDEEQREALLADLAQRYDIAPQALEQERAALRTPAVLLPARRLRPTAQRTA